MFKSLRNFLSLFDRIALKSVPGKRHVTGLLPVIGYTLVFASLGDFVYLLFPLRLQSAAWELQTLGSLVEQCWGFLIGLALIFSRYLLDNQEDIREVELVALKWIRWFVFGIAILLILSTPLIVFNTLRLYPIINQQISAKEAPKLAQIQQLETQLGQTSDPKTVMAIAQSLNFDLKNIQNAPLLQLKNTVKERLNTFRTDIKTQVQRTQQEQSTRLIKNSIRTLYSGLIMSFTFIFIWFKIGKFRRKLLSYYHRIDNSSLEPIVSHERSQDKISEP